MARTDAEPIYRLITTILDPKRAPAKELAALYHERWEIETALDELKTHLPGAQIVLHSARQPQPTRQMNGSKRIMIVKGTVLGLIDIDEYPAPMSPPPDRIDRKTMRRYARNPSKPTQAEVSSRLIA